MKISKFLKLNNISFSTFLQILSCSEWLNSEWGFSSFNLNSVLDDTQILLVQKLVDNYDSSKLIKQAEINRYEKTNLIQLLNKKNSYFNQFYKDFLPIEIITYDDNEKNDAIRAYVNTILFISYNIETNYSNTIEFFSKLSKDNINLNSVDYELIKISLIQFHQKLLQNKKLKSDEKELSLLIHSDMETYLIFPLISKLFAKYKSPFEASNLLLRFRKMNKEKIREIKYKNYPPYKQFINYKKLLQKYNKDDSGLTSSHSVYSSPHPFRN